MLSRTKRAKYLGGALTAICELMRSFGISKPIAEREFRKALKHGYATGNLRPSKQVRPITRLARVCTRWHIDKKYIDDMGAPRPLTWNGKRGSLKKLVGHVVGRDASHEVIVELISRKLLRKTRTGAWLPKSKVVSPSGIDTAQILRTATMMERLLRTVVHNSELKYRGEVLLEVMARVPNLPTHEISKFKKFSKAQGLIFAKTVDDWLESRNAQRVGRSRVSTREAGIVAFAFHRPSND